VADVWLWPEDEATSGSDILGIERAREHARRALCEARELAARAGERLRSRFPQWKITTEAVGDSPAWALIKKADEWNPDLVVVGSHGRTA
ncbi:universal stress protein, partial [Acinetobacter baumannii]